MDAINSLLAGMQSSEATFNGAAQQIASMDLPSAIVPDPTNPSHPQPQISTNVDPAQQLTTMMVAADSHHLSAAAMKVALSMYQDAINMASEQAQQQEIAS
jgi:hypothetical protein